MKSDNTENFIYNNIKLEYTKSIFSRYKSGGVMDVQVLITANHNGFFTFNLCNLDSYKKESEECFENIALNQTNGEPKYYIDDQVRIFDVKLQLPEKFVCQHCVLQWTWITGKLL